ncbi:MAG TPA: ATP-dependent DNA ligase [Lacipirellulaceae bacterium]|nr:ATP-dependent DNA ligase [Lacipirellulaceae bacterium]
MPLPLWPPYAPMEAESVPELPTGDQWQYEPKWDGFRCVCFRDGTRVELQSKSMKPLARYFPEVVAAVASMKPKRFALDGELVIPIGASFSFDQLLQRIHPAESRILKLASEYPARFIVFDILVDARGKNLARAPLSERRVALEAFAAEHFLPEGLLSLSPATTDRKATARWAKRAGTSLDGIVAKRLDLDYRTGERDGMVKVKRMKTADCVVGGFRYAAKRLADGRPAAGSLLLGLYNDQGLLDHVGFIALGKALGTGELTAQLEKLSGKPGFTGQAPGGPSRWSTDRSSEWTPLKSRLVVEVQFDHFTGGRFRHGTKFLRWRPDKSPRQCTLDQVARGGGSPLLLVEGGGAPRRSRR